MILWALCARALNTTHAAFPPPEPDQLKPLAADRDVKVATTPYSGVCYVK